MVSAFKQYVREAKKQNPPPNRNRQRLASIGQSLGLQNINVPQDYDEEDDFNYAMTGGEQWDNTLRAGANNLFDEHKPFKCVADYCRQIKLGVRPMSRKPLSDKQLITKSIFASMPETNDRQQGQANYLLASKKAKFLLERAAGGQSDAKATLAQSIQAAKNAGLSIYASAQTKPQKVQKALDPTKSWY